MLFDPLGIQDVEWVRYANGTPNAVSGLRMRPRDLAKIGQIVLAGSIWNDRRIDSAVWIEASKSPHLNGEDLRRRHRGCGYGETAFPNF